MDNLPFSNIEDRPETLKYLEDLDRTTNFTTLQDNYYEQLRAVLNYGPRSKDKDWDNNNNNSNECPLLEDVFVGTHLITSPTMILKDAENTPDDIMDIYYSILGLMPMAVMPPTTSYMVNNKEIDFTMSSKRNTNINLSVYSDDHAVTHTWTSSSYLPLDVYVKAILGEVTSLPDHLHTSITDYKEEVKDYLLTSIAVSGNFVNLVTKAPLLDIDLQQGVKLLFLKEILGVRHI